MILFIAVCVKARAQVRKLPEGAADQQDHRGEPVPQARCGRGRRGTPAGLLPHSQQPLAVSAYMCIHASQGLNQNKNRV